MKRIVHDCDRCGAMDISPVLAFTAYFGENPEKCSEKVDIEICVTCAGKLLAIQLDSIKNDAPAFAKFKKSLESWKRFLPDSEKEKKQG